jgi:hypothetical protein
MSLRGVIYGLQIEANQAIPGLGASVAVSRPDLEICLGAMPDWLKEEPAREPWYVSAQQGESGLPGLQVWAISGGRGQRLLYADGTEFVIDAEGSRLWSRWPEHLTLEDTATYLLGPVMGFVLLLRGIICLHASAIAIGNAAVAMVGPPEAGKSTTAAVLARLGYAVISDDVVTLDERDGAFLVHPTYALIRLWPESVEALYGSADALPRLTPTWNKRYLDVTEKGYRFQRDPLPLAAIYVLEERTTDPAAPRIEDLRGKAALMSLVANLYVARLMNGPMSARGLDLLARVAASVPVRRVVPHVEVANLTRLCDMIIDDVQALAQSRQPARD